MEDTKKKQKYLQDNLQLIRRCGGWTTVEFSNLIGMSRQTLNTLENKTAGNEMTKSQYMAIRYALQEELLEDKEENLLIKNILEVFVDNPEPYTKEEKDQLRKKAEKLSEIAMSKIKNGAEEASKDWAEWLDKIVDATLIATSALAILINSNRKILSKNIGKKLMK